MAVWQPLTLYPQRACAEIIIAATRQDIEKMAILYHDDLSCKLVEFTSW